MELKEFIKETLTQIAEGIISAQEESAKTGAIISPQLTKKSKDSFVVWNDDRGDQHVSEIKFKVGVTVSEKDGSKAGLAVLTGLLSAGAQKTGESINESITTVEFDVPMVLPPGDVTEKPKPHKFIMSI